MRVTSETIAYRSAVEAAMKIDCDHRGMSIGRGYAGSTPGGRRPITAT
jgi:hypothetical protein